MALFVAEVRVGAAADAEEVVHQKGGSDEKEGGAEDDGKKRVFGTGGVNDDGGASKVGRFSMWLQLEGQGHVEVASVETLVGDIGVPGANGREVFAEEGGVVGAAAEQHVAVADGAVDDEVVLFV